MYMSGVSAASGRVVLIRCAMTVSAVTHADALQTPR